jgi:hypothetical protein
MYWQVFKLDGLAVVFCTEGYLGSKQFSLPKLLVPISYLRELFWVDTLGSPLPSLPLANNQKHPVVLIKKYMNTQPLPLPPLFLPVTTSHRQPPMLHHCCRCFIVVFIFIISIIIVVVVLLLLSSWSL